MTMQKFTGRFSEKILLFILVIMILTLLWGMRLSLFSTTLSAQDVSVPQLNGDEVLSIIARPLPVDSPRGYFLVNISLTHANLTGVNLTRAQLDFSDLSNNDMDYGVLLGVSANYVDFSNSSLADANLQDATLTFSNFTNANFTSSNLRNAVLADSNFTSASFTLAYLESANFLGSEIAGATFTDAILENTILPDGSVYVDGRNLMAEFGTDSNP